MIYHWFGDLHGTSGGYSYQRFLILDCKNTCAQPNYYNIIDICIPIISHHNLQLFDAFGLNFHPAILAFTGLVYIFSLTQLQPHPIGIVIGTPNRREANVSPNHSGNRQPEHLGSRLAQFWEKFVTLPETTSSHLKMDGWKTSLSFWDGGFFGGELLVLGSVRMC